MQESWKLGIKDLIYFEYDELNLANGVQALALKVGTIINAMVGNFLPV